MVSVVRFKHYKGSVYEFICEASHSETGEKLVIYKNGMGEFYARPSSMFFEEVENNGQLVPRFQKLEE